MFLVPNIDQGNEENSVNIASQVSIVEFEKKHGNGDEFPDFADLFFLGRIILVGLKKKKKS
jgi:hypothetical protein